MEGLMMTAIEDDMNDRIRFLESEMAGEKVVTRHILEMAQRNGADIAAVRVDLATLKLQVDRMGSDVNLVKAALTSQTGILNVLVQDVRGMRTEMGEVRAKLDRMDARFDGLDARLDRMDARFDGLDARLDRMDARFDAVLVAIRALSPHAPLA
jgi:septal ring factor EnvC (AmiA/AmiB activator)